MLVDDHRTYIFNHLKKKFPKVSIEDLEDIVQDAMIKAHRFEGNYKANCSLKTWLATIAVNTSYDRFRKPFVKHEQLLSGLDSEYIFENLSEKDFSETFCNENYQKQICKKLLYGFEHDLHVQAFLLFNLNENTYKEISQIQNIPLGTVKSRIFRGKKILLERYTQLSLPNLN